MECLQILKGVKKNKISLKTIEFSFRNLKKNLQIVHFFLDSIPWTAGCHDMEHR